MVEVGIPCWHARETLSKGLDSLVAQTKNKFIVCISIDGDNEDYNDIIETYRARGLKIRVINSKENGGPGMARQRIIDTTQCDYIMFMDADDMLMPRAVEILYTTAKAKNFDILRSSFIREHNNKEDELIPQNVKTITWFHGKIYKTAYLKERNIRFLPGLYIDEDAYFNLLAWNSTQNRGEITEVTYFWRYNKNSLTRKENNKIYFLKTYKYYIYSQVEGLKKLFVINDSVANSLITQTLLNIYYYYMTAKFYKDDTTYIDELISTLKQEQWMQVYLNTGENWFDIVTNIKAGTIYEQKYVVFYTEHFNEWAARLLKDG